MHTILLVDDDKEFRASIHRRLQLAGHNVLEACDGDEAIALLSRTSVDVVVTDVLMPRRDGLQTIQEIRTRWPALKIIAISGGGFLNAELYLDLSVKLGATLALEKPFSCDELLTAMKGVLARVKMVPIAAPAPKPPAAIP